jgi:hypothetical protein
MRGARHADGPGIRQPRRSSVEDDTMNEPDEPTTAENPSTAEAGQTASLGPQRVAVSFVEDTVTAIASWYVGRFADIHLEIPGKNRTPDDWMRARTELETALAGKAIQSVIITGHGNAGDIGHHAINSVELDNPATGCRAFLEWLGSRMAANNDGIRINCCHVAQNDNGKDLITRMATIMKTRVKAWDDWYAIVPHGKEFTGYPDGTWTQTSDTKRAFGGSILSWFVPGGKGRKKGT